MQPNSPLVKQPIGLTRMKTQTMAKGDLNDEDVIRGDSEVIPADVNDISGE